MSQLTPTATGSLETTPLSHLLVYALDRQLTGSLVLEDPERKKSAIYFMDGSPCKVKTADPVAYLGHVLVELGSIDESTYVRTLDRARRAEELHGRILIADGCIDALALKEGLREQVSRQILWLFKQPATSLYGYYDGIDFLERWGGSDAPLARPLALLWRALREHADPIRVEQMRSFVGQQQLKLHHEAPVSRFGFDRVEQSVIDVLRAKPQPLAELLGRDLADPARVLRLIYVLVMTRQFDFGNSEQTPMLSNDADSSSRMAVARSAGTSVLPNISLGAAPGVGRLTPPVRPAVSISPPPMSQRPGAPAAPSVTSGTPNTTQTSARTTSPQATRSPTRTTSPVPNSVPSVPPGGRATSPAVEDPLAAIKEDIRQRANSRGQSYYEILDVTKEAGTAQIQAAFFQLAKRFHPDRLGPDFEDIRGEATRAFARMSEAHQTLGDARRRKEYDDVLATGGGSADEQEKVTAVLRAATAFQKAEVHLKKGNLEAAKAEAQRAATDDPEQCEYGAFVAWIDVQQPERTNFDEQLRVLNEALKKEPQNDRIRWYRGQLYKRSGQESKAASDFRKILETNPRHVEAARELRLHEMRRVSSRPPAAGKGLGRWFKR